MHYNGLASDSRTLTTHQELFYTHQELYHFKRLVMGASLASQEFYDKFRIVRSRLQGVLQIQDNLLVYGNNGNTTHI